jgi:hypothetical protein
MMDFMIMEIYIKKNLNTFRTVITLWSAGCADSG